MNYTIQRCASGWLISAHGKDQIVCERDELTLGIIKEAERMLQLDERSQQLEAEEAEVSAAEQQPKRASPKAISPSAV